MWACRSERSLHLSLALDWMASWKGWPQEAQGQGEDAQWRVERPRALEMAWVCAWCDHAGHIALGRAWLRAGFAAVCRMKTSVVQAVGRLWVNGAAQAQV